MRFLIPVLAGWLAVVPAMAQERMSVIDGGVRRSMEVARDELVLTRKGGPARQVRFAARRGAREVAAHGREMLKAPGERPSLVLYEEGEERNEMTQRIVTGWILVRAADARAAAELAVKHGIVKVRRAKAAAGYFLFDVPDPLECLAVVEALRGEAGVTHVEPLLARRYEKRGAPNDPLYGQQWHLKNTGQGGGTAGIDANVETAWGTFGGAGNRGSGIVIGIVDDGLEITHPDLAPNVDTVLDWDFDDGDNDPSPVTTFDNHGTTVAGVAAAAGNNALGVSGVAPEATLVGLRLTSSFASDAEEEAAFLHENDDIHIKNNSWGPSDNGRTLEAPGVLAQAAIEDSIANGRGGLGTIIVWAAGNGLTGGDNINKDGYANSIYTIAVGGIGDDGEQAHYSEPGAPMMVTAPSSSNGHQSVTTTYLLGQGPVSSDYTDDFGGTSSAAPLVSGVVALMLEENPALGWRDVQEILLDTAVKNHVADAGWIVNGAGRNFNHKYGAGMVDASAAVALAGSWVNLPAQASVEIDMPALNLALPSDDPVGVDVDYDFSASDLRVEHVVVEVDITHTYRGDVIATLTSPSGTVSELTSQNNDRNNDYPDWKLMTVANWGEDSKGTWRLHVHDFHPEDDGTLNSAKITIFGTTKTYTLSGVATEVVTGEPLAGVTISAGGVNAVTDGSGNYDLVGLVEGSYNAIATRADHSTDSAMVTVGPSANENFNLLGPLNLLDPDEDDVENLLEAAFVMDYEAADAGLLPQTGTVDVGGQDYPAVSYRRLKGGTGTTGVDYTVNEVVYRVAYSHNLVDWFSGASEVEAVSVVDDGNFETVTVRVETLPGEPQTYFRVEVEHVPPGP